MPKSPPAGTPAPDFTLRNQDGEEIISTDSSRVTVCVVPTDEELEIAAQCRMVLGSRG